MSDQAGAPASAETVSTSAAEGGQTGTQAVGQSGSPGGQGDVAASSGPARDDSGRFAAKPKLGQTLDDIPNSDFEPGKPGEKPAAKPASKPGMVARPIPDAKGAAPVPPPAKYKFAGKEYDTQEQAEQAHRTLQGMFKPQQEAMANLRRELEALRAASQAPAAQPTVAPPASKPPATPAGPMDGIDLALYKQIAESQGPAAAAYWLTQEVTKGVTERMEAAYNEKLTTALAPFQKSHEQGQMLQLAEGLFTELASYTTADASGNPSPTYPELYDGDSAERIGHIWANLPIPIEARNTPTGMYMAVCVYRDQLRAGMYAPSLSPSSQPPQPGNPAPQAAALHPGSAEAAAAVAAALGRTPASGDALSGGYPANRGNGSATEADVIRAGLDRAHQVNRLTGVSR